MKAFIKKLSIILISVTISSCSKDDTSANNGTLPSGNSNLGTFAGNIQVTDDPQTKLGYIYNAEVTINTSGVNATVKIIGDGGFNREFTGLLSAGSTQTNSSISLSKQTKPVDKNVSGNVFIDVNELLLNMNIPSDAVSVKSTTTGVAFNIDGKIKMLGTNFIRK